MMAWIRGLRLNELEEVTHKVEEAKEFTYLAKRLNNGAIAWVCAARDFDDDKDRIVARGLVPRELVLWICSEASSIGP